MGEKHTLAVFDSGVGSYSIVAAIRKKLPTEHILYLADRASFPYGEKSREELLGSVDRAVTWLEQGFHPELIVVGSNTPSVQVLPELAERHGTPLVGVFPPIKEAALLTKTGHIAILGTRGAMVSPEMKSYIQSASPAGVFVSKVNAGEMVALVEPGTFLSDPDTTRTTIRSVLDPVFSNDPDIDVMTLSSTHLPFLRPYLVELYPSVTFLDPADIVADEVLKRISPSEGQGGVSVYVTEGEDGALSAEEFQTILGNLGLNVPVHTTEIPMDYGA